MAHGCGHRAILLTTVHRHGSVVADLRAIDRPTHLTLVADREQRRRRYVSARATPNIPAYPGI